MLCTMRNFYCIILCLSLSPIFTAQLFINEYSCSNMAGPTDAFGENEDWIEIYNAGGTAIDLTGYFLVEQISNYKNRSNGVEVNLLYID